MKEKIFDNDRKKVLQQQRPGGVRFGRIPKPLPENFHECYQDWKMGKIACIEAAKRCEMPESTFRYCAEVYKNSKLLQNE